MLVGIYIAYNRDQRGYDMDTYIWVYVEDHNGNLLCKEYTNPDAVFAVLKTICKVVATIATGLNYIVYRLYD